MKLLLSALVLAGALLPVAALSTALRAAPPPPAALSISTLRGTAGPDLYPDSLLVASAAGGLRLSRDDGEQWSTPRGPLPPGAYYTVVADSVISGAAYATNGDLYQTTDAGQDWRPLSVPSAGLGPAGVTALACGDDGTLYAAGPTVLAYHAGRWRTLGRGWPANVQSIALLPTPARGLYVAAGDRLYRSTDGRGGWTQVARWSGVVDALTLGPDRATPYVAVRGQGVWRIDANGAHPLAGDDGPGAAPIYTLESDPAGNDLYAATDHGLLRRHRPGDPVANPWQQALDTAGDHIVTLRPWEHGQRMIALSSRGHMYVGTRRNGQSLVWNGQSRDLRLTTPLLAALSGTEWQRIDALPLLPAAFTGLGPCAFLGPTAGQSFDVCGPFRAFYYYYAGNRSLFGYPTGPARRTANGGVAQDFEKVRMVWGPRPYRPGDFNLGASLAPVVLDRVRAGHLHFKKPSIQQYQQGDAPSAYGYFVAPRFYPFWRAYQDAGEVSIFGGAISQDVREPGSDGTGTSVRVQYFENARLEERGGTVVVSFLSSVPAG